MPCKDQRRQGLSCHLADIDGILVEKARCCKTECEDGEFQLGSQSLLEFSTKEFELWNLNSDKLSYFNPLPSLMLKSLNLDCISKEP